jgi:hypothetical protein
VVLDDGHVLVAGGLGSGWTYLADAEVFDPRTASFSRVGSMEAPREGHVAVRLRSGQVLVVGGHTGPRGQLQLHQSCETYDPTNREFRRVGDLLVRRHKHDAVLLADGRVLVSGGSDERDNQGVYDSTELFDPATATFAPGPTMRSGRYKHAGTSLLLADGRVLIAGGAPRAEIYDPIGRTFEFVAGEARMSGQFSAVALLNADAALITGGYGNGGGPRSAAWLCSR